MDIISRGRWGARYQRGFGPAPLPAQEVWLHHSVTGAPAADLVLEAAAMRTLEDIGQQRFGGGISYTFAVMPSGRVYEGHGVDRQGAHTANRNSIARAIVLAGNYDAEPVTEAQVRAVAELLQHGHAAGWWRAARLTGGHQQAPGAETACPGRHAMAVIPNINRLAGGGLIEEDDMPTPKDLLNWPVARQGSKLGGRTTLGAVVANIDRAWEMQTARDAAILAAVTTISRDPGITPGQLAAVVDQAVAGHTPTAEQIAAASRPAIADAVAAALGADNEGQADAIVDAIVDRLANTNTEEN
ncbi:N-acetylmuramoyl-L-alanine amidase [Actinophytocola sediminis]